MIPVRALFGGGVVLAILAALFFGYRFVHAAATDAANLAHIQRIEELRAEHARSLAALKARFDAEITATQDANAQLERSYKEFENATHETAVADGCGAPAGILRSLEAIR